MWLAAVIILFLIALKIYNVLSTGKCTSDAVMTGKVVIVTGGRTGIGYEAARDLARRGAKVIIASSNEKLGLEAKDRIIAATRNKNVAYMQLDLASLDSVRKFVDDFKKNEVKLDVLINNSGAAALGNKHTADGILKEMQINYYGPFLLTILLMPLLKKADSGRIVNVSSVMHYFGKIDLKKINQENYYSELQTYNNSKLCNVLFSNELSRRLKGSGVVTNSVHPGHVKTGIYSNRGGAVELIMNLVLGIWFKNAKEGAQTLIHLAVSEQCDQVSGKYFVDCKAVGVSALAMDRDVAGQLWLHSEKVVKLKLTETI